MFIRLKDSGIEPTGFTTLLPTLDDVFLALTGHAAEEASEEKAETAGKAAR